MYTDLVNGITVTKNRENILANDISSISTEGIYVKLTYFYLLKFFKDGKFRNCVFFF